MNWRRGRRVSVLGIGLDVVPPIEKMPTKPDQAQMATCDRFGGEDAFLPVGQAQEVRDAECLRPRIADDLRKAGEVVDVADVVAAKV